MTDDAGLMVSGPLVVVSIVSGVRSVIGDPESGAANTISSSAEVVADAEPIAARNEPGPESAALVTVNVSALAAAGSATKAVTPEIRTARAEERKKMTVSVRGDGEHGRRRAELQISEPQPSAQLRAEGTTSLVSAQPGGALSRPVFAGGQG
jgi:hypothetical protein